MYEQLRIEKTYACITQTANSKPIIAKKIAKGTKVNIPTISQAPNIL